jgi:glutamate racemase
MSDERAIGVFDSGLGGLTVVRELFRLMPHERVVYLGDTARVPYGGRSEEAIARYGIQNTRFLMSMDIKMLIVACNTVSSVALEQVRAQVEDIPVIGVVIPGCKAAVSHTAEKKVGVIGTRATINASAYTKGIHAVDPGIKVYGKACPLFVPLVEEGLLNHDITQMAAQYYLYELVDIGIDCLILGCTHYPLIMEIIQATVSNRIELVDSALWTAKEAGTILSALDANAIEGGPGIDESQFYVTDLNPNFEKLATQFLGHTIKNIQKIQIEQLTSLTA